MSRGWMRRCGVCAFAAVAGSVAMVRADVIGQLSDPAQPSCDGCVDILAAAIEQDGGLLTFTIETREPIPVPIVDPNEQVMFLWLVDADNDPNTGQPHSQVGTEFNVRVCLNSLYGGGFVDVTGALPGGGTGEVFVNGATVQITIWLAQIANPSQFHWACDAAHVYNNVAVSANYETAVAVANTQPYTAPARVTVTTPLLMLCPTGPSTGQLGIEVRDTAENLLPLANYHLTCASSNPTVATVDTTGVASAHAVPVEFWDTPYVEVWADGVRADNLAVLRVTSTNLGVTHQMYAGADVAFYIPPQIEGVDLDQITSEYEVVAMTDLAYAAQEELIDAAPFNGGLHYFVLDVTDDPVTVPCGLSGNPVRLGWEYGKPIHNSCYIVNVPDHRVPQWSVYFHEMGHNFTWRSWGFGQFCGASETNGWKYSEAFASMAGAWSWYRLARCPSGLDPDNVASIAEFFPNINPAWRGALHDYQAAGANYADVSVEVICDIMWDMYDDYSPQVWYDVFSTFTPADEPLPMAMSGDIQQATWLVAALSASAGEDLRARFVTDYGFPIDDAAWSEMLTAASARIAARPWQTPAAGDFDCDGDIDIADFVSLSYCLTGPEGGLGSPNCRFSDLERDADIDLADLAPFQLSFTGD